MYSTCCFPIVCKEIEVRFDESVDRNTLNIQYFSGQYDLREDSDSDNDITSIYVHKNDENWIVYQCSDGDWYLINGGGTKTSIYMNKTISTGSCWGFLSSIAKSEDKSKHLTDLTWQVDMVIKCVGK